MDEDDCRTLIAVLADELRSVGAGDIADERHYLRLDRAGGEARLLDPRTRLIEMLRAFERWLAIRDRATYSAALGRLDGVLRGRGPRGAMVEIAAEEGRAAELVDLGRAPELGELRHDVRRLVDRLIGDGRPPRERY
jgi:hypothetical protein